MREWIMLTCRRLSFVVVVLSLLISPSSAKGGLCEVETGQSNIILDIEESRGTEITQLTTPEELPIIGDPFSEVALDLVFASRKPVFILNGKRLQLIEPLDRDADNLSHIVFQLTCTVKSTNKKRTIPVIVRVSDVNDNPPHFLNTPYETTVPELTPIGTTIFQNIQAKDSDAGVNGLLEYAIVEGNGEGIGTSDGVGRNRITIADGFSYFAINLPHQGQVTVNRTLDYERTQRYLVTIVASDRARNASERFSTTTTLTVNIRDDDDQDPSFIYKGCMLLDGVCINPEYQAYVSSGMLSGVLNVHPEKIQAIDMDSINAPVEYSILSGIPSNFHEYFQINPSTGAVRQVKAVDTTVTKKFELIVKAEEASEARRFTTAKLSITVKPVDSNPPEIQASAIEGFVLENAPIGTRVVDENEMPITFVISDADLGPDDPKPPYSFELTTNFFDINNKGELIVNEENLDRDPPSPGKFKFQIVAREKSNSGNAASTPLSVSVTLIDVNDNAPHIPVIPTVQLKAGEGKRDVIKVVASDNDYGENAIVSYGIYHVSNNGRGKFKIDSATGQITTSGKLNAGEQYSITVQATDTGGKSSQTIVEVNVIPGPNTRSPVFSQPVYDVQVSEGASINSTVVTIHATDPEDDPVSYSILSGNDLRQFTIGDKSGVISVIRKLDREDLTRYQLLIEAEDSGGLSSTATVNIKVTDINDKNPEFVNLPYEFRVKEGEKNKIIGNVHAHDADEGANADIHYSLPNDVPFHISQTTGDIITNMSLDYETQKEYKFVVTAKDGAPDPRIATATVTVHVTDTEDELPFFHLLEQQVKAPENVPEYVITQVKADDPDTIKKITYIIKQGPTDLFTIDEQTGIIRCIRGLDYERENQYTLVIGTLENQEDTPGSTTKVIINVEDRNDIPPVFNTVPRPITLEDEVSIGTIVTKLVATDSDGTAPGNKVRYELIGRRKALRYFQVDPDTGTVTVKDDLRKETDTEYQVDIRAYDLGEPALSSVTTVPVYVRHTATLPPETGLGFADDYYTVEVYENATARQLLKTLTVINSQAQNGLAPLRCDIIAGDDDGLFYTNITLDRNCELRLKSANLDHETKEEYLLTLRLDTLSGLVNPQRAESSVKLHVLDINDNKPQFIYPYANNKLNKHIYFGVVSHNSQLGSPVLSVKAEDKDSDKFSNLVYEIIPNNDGSSHFIIDNITGVIRTKKLLTEVKSEQLPFKFKVGVKDNPKGLFSNKAEAQVVINLIDEQHRMILVVEDARQDTIKEAEDKIISILQEHTGLVIGVEKVTPKQFLNENTTLESDNSGTDVWFYAIDPESENILDRNNSRIQREIFDKQAMSNITFNLSGNLQATATVIHEPLVEIRPRTAIAAVSWDVFPYAIIVIACLILILGVVGIVYICISWSRYKAYKERMQRLYVVPKYDPVQFVEPNNLKEYETQVLQMSVPVDDNESYNDLQLDFSAKNHAFSMENVSYITKDNNTYGGGPSPVSSQGTLSRNHHNNLLNNHDHRHSPMSNSLYSRSSEDGLNHNLNRSCSNDNVLFREKKDFSHLGYNNYCNDRSPVETTTEL